MCDYSLANERTRLAVVGEELVLHQFRQGTRGFTSPQELADLGKTFTKLKSKVFNSVKQDPCAVCIPPGAKLQISGIGSINRNHYHISENEEVTFTQTSMDANRHRDAVIFKNGAVVRIQYFAEGLIAKIISLEGAIEREPVHEHAFAAR